MCTQPTGEQLLDSADKLLRELLLPTLPASQRQAALMIARAMAIAARQLRQGEHSEREELAELAHLLAWPPIASEQPIAAVRTNLRVANLQLCRLIRSGQADSGEQRRNVMAQLKRANRQQLALSNPRVLKSQA
jgi:hypothetical protein